MSYVDPFKDLNDTKRKEREALLNHPELGQVARNSPPPGIIPPTISRRDYFAAAALQGMFANPEYWFDDKSPYEDVEESLEAWAFRIEFAMEILDREEKNIER